MERESDAWPEATPVPHIPNAWSTQGLQALRVDVPEGARVVLKVLRPEHVFYRGSEYCSVLEASLNGPVPSDPERAADRPLTTWEWRSQSFGKIRGPLLIVAQVVIANVVPDSTKLRVRLIPHPHHDARPEAA